MSYRALFYPRGVAVFGSAAPGKLANILIQRITEGGMENICAINPKGQGVGAVPGYTSLSDAGFPIDLAVIASPAFTVAGVMEECGMAGVKAAAVITSGFSEAGNAEGEKAVKEAAEKYGIRFVGPNCAGVVNTHANLLATLETRPPKGNVAIVSQSGAVGGVIMSMAGEQGVGISKFVSFGNGLDLSVTDFMDWLREDDETKVIAMYLETVKYGRGFMKSLSRLARVKPVVVVKSGRTATGQRAALSHTGSMAGADSVFDAALYQSGALRAESLEDMFDLCKGFSCLPEVRGRKLLVVTNSGGPGVLATDKAEELGIEIPEPTEALKEKLGGFLPSYAGLRNPIDLTVEGTGEQYGKSAAIGLSEYDAALAIYVGTPYLKALPVAEALADAAKETGKPVLATLCVGSDMDEAEGCLIKEGVPNFVSGERAVKTISGMARYYSRRDAFKGPAAPDGAKETPGLEGPMSEPAAMDLLEKSGIPVPPHRFCKTREEAASACTELGFPAVMKVVSPDIIHKSDVGGVILNISSDKEAAEAFDRLGKVAAGQRFLGTICYPMLKGGREVILGLVRDPQFGPVVAFGLGGIYTEVLKDVVFRVAPVDKETAGEMIRSIKMFPMLAGARGQAPADTDALAEAVAAFSQLPFKYPEIKEADLNPVLVFEKGVRVLDARIIG
ncbi:MAG: acetate--CoA ligase family protein [Oscillospiraceae bacterium]